MINQSRSNILIVDDEIEVVELLSKFLSKRGYNIFTANNGRDALNILKSHRIKVLFCDIVMPEMHGLELLDKIKENNIDVQIIMITGQQCLASCIEESIHNVCDFLIKPTSRETILKSLECAENKASKEKTRTIRNLGLYF